MKTSANHTLQNLLVNFGVGGISRFLLGSVIMYTFLLAAIGLANVATISTSLSHSWSGLWHGAAWSFVLWGGLHGLYQVLDKMRKKYLPKLGLPLWLKDSIGIVTTFVIVTIAWIFFRLTDVGMAWDAVVKIFSSAGMPFADLPTFVYGFSSIAILLSVDFLINRNHNKESNATKNSGIFTVFRFAFALILVFWIISTGISVVVSLFTSSSNRII